MFYFLNKEFWFNPWLVFLFLATLFVIIFTRYFVFAKIYSNVLSRFSNNVRNKWNFNRVQIQREIKWSILSSLVFTIFSGFGFWAYQQGLTKIYNTISDYSLIYFCMGPFLLLVLYETYYYWLHRIMHIPIIFKYVHKAHHQSIHPTVFASFAFHPLEAVLQFLFFLIIIFVMPLHYAVLLATLMIMTVSAVINHSGIEIFKSKISKHLIGSTHHDLHHEEFKTNYGLYFTWWDKWMKTESKKNSQLFSNSSIGSIKGKGFNNEQ